VRAAAQRTDSAYLVVDGQPAARFDRALVVTIHRDPADSAGEAEVLTSVVEGWVGALPAGHVLVVAHGPPARTYAAFVAGALAAQGTPSSAVTLGPGVELHTTGRHPTQSCELTRS
jgi:hypothetical protein